MSAAPNFSEALRRQREAFADRYEASQMLTDAATDVDAMFADDEAEPITNYADRRGE